jgi:hypothetical protein
MAARGISNEGGIALGSRRPNANGGAANQRTGANRAHTNGGQSKSNQLQKLEVCCGTLSLSLALVGGRRFVRAVWSRVGV